MRGKTTEISRVNPVGRCRCCGEQTEVSPRRRCAWCVTECTNEGCVRPTSHAYRGPISEVGDSGWKCDLCGRAADDPIHFSSTDSGHISTTVAMLAVMIPTLALVGWTVVSIVAAFYRF